MDQTIVARSTKRRLITSALPYVNNIPHLGNIIQVLSADVYARFCRSRGYQTLYICGTDEYGTATETRAREEGVSPKELCDRYFVQHQDIYRWFNISFDKFGRTTDPAQTRIVQDIFLQIYEAGFISSHTQKQLYSEVSDMFLADRYVRGTCPKCGYQDARGDQCENCGVLLDPLELISPVSVPDGSAPVVRETVHLYLNLPKLLPHLQEWMSSAKEKGFWTKNSVKMTEAWLRDGLRERAITRDLQWGIPVPLKEFSSKVFYVWFDAPIGYVSITAGHTDDWEQWWHNPDEVELVQFIGKDNIPFHTVLFPSTQLAWEIACQQSSSCRKKRWTKVHHVSSTEYLNYEGGMFSKSRGIGVFGNDAMNAGIPADMWRFYMIFNRPETSDYMFTWEDFQESVNGQLINNLSNLCNRTFSFICKSMAGSVDPLDASDGEVVKMREEIIAREKTITMLMEKVELRKAYRAIFLLSNYGNKLFQDNAPWKLSIENSARIKKLLSCLVYLIRDLAVLIEPFTPDMAQAIVRHMKLNTVPSWDALAAFGGKCDLFLTIEKPVLLFSRLEDERIVSLKERFSGSQLERSVRSEQMRANAKDMQNVSVASPSAQKPSAQSFANRVRLVAAKIVQIKPHPDADKLYILSLDDGSAQRRIIVSGLRDYYREQDLENKTIIIAANLKKAKFRGVESSGMLLAASSSEGVHEQLEVLFLPDDTAAGTHVMLDGIIEVPEKEAAVKAAEFFTYDLCVIDHTACGHGAPFIVNGQKVCTHRVANGRIG